MRLQNLILAGLFGVSSTLLSQSQTNGLRISPVPGLPFTAKETVVFTRTGPDGSPVTSTLEEKVARNALGQVYREVRRPNRNPAPDQPATILTGITIVDPVARTSTFCAAASHLCNAAPLREDTQASRNPTSQSLGDDVIDGIAVSGTRESFSFPSSQPGVPASSVSSDAWYSSELKCTLALTVDDSRQGKRTDRLAILDRAEPDPALFSLPAGYSMDTTIRPTPPKVIKQVAPEFSEEARRKKIGGNILVSLVVDESGNPTSIRVVRGIGYGLDQKAVEAVEGYRFQPATKSGVPVKAELLVSVNFQIFK